MNFDVNGFIEMIDDRLGNLAGDALLAFVVFGIIIWIGVYIWTKLFHPIFLSIREWKNMKIGDWDVGALLLVSFLFVCLI